MWKKLGRIVIFNLGKRWMKAGKTKDCPITSLEERVCRAPACACSHGRVGFSTRDTHRQREGGAYLWGKTMELAVLRQVGHEG